MIATPSPPSTRGRLSLRVHAQPRLGDPLEPGDRALPGGPVLERDHQLLADLRVLHLPPRDVALLLEDLGDVNLDLGMRHRHGVVVRRVGVAQTGQHVCDRVGHGHGLEALLAAVSLGPSAWSVGAGRAQVWSVRAYGSRRRRLPAGLGDTGKLAPVRHGPEADAAQAEPAVDRTRPSAREHLVYPRTANFGVRFALAIRPFFATRQLSLNGNPSRRKSERPSSSLIAVVTTVTSMPRCRSTWSGLISWNISCSVRPKV